MNKLNFIINRIPDSDLLEGVLTDSMFSLSIHNSEDVKNLDLKYFHKKEFYTSFHFSIFLNFEDTPNSAGKLIKELEQNKDLLLQLFFHPCFEKKSNMPLLFLNHGSKNNPAIDSFIKTIDSLCFSQGFDGIETIYLCHNHHLFSNDADVLIKYKDAEDFQKIYYQLLAKELYAARYLGITGTSDLVSSKIYNLQLETEKKLMKDLPSQFHFLQQYSHFAKQVPLLQEELRFLKSDLANQKIYLQLFKDKDESIKINEFYHNEYEILPLWYKKFGHILKVLMGKRTFNSLFDNNVKKYKN